VPPDSTATKARLLDAAFAEFAQYGLAGARVDRIAEAAQANKRLIYVYYGSKEQLFDAVLAQRVGALFDAVPFTADDLPGFVGSLFDHLAASPQLLRLSRWRQLERVEPSVVETDWTRETVEAIAQAQQRGVITADLAPADLLTLLLGMTTSWFSLPSAMSEVAVVDARSPQRLQQRRAALTTAACRLLGPSPHAHPHRAGAQTAIPQ
jgi:AcrR family transcriptional regulator